MASLDLKQKLAILSDAAKYDASCASSGTTKRDSMGGKGVGSTEGMGICHAYAPDGRCISLLKILLTNFCVYDCVYCVNRVTSNTRRARFTVKEVVDLTLGFYKRNYIEGLFLSSGIIRNADYTMEEMVRVAKSLRLDHDFRGYIHLKVIPEASPGLVNQAALYADRVSINIELPRDDSLADLAPEKDAKGIRKAMGSVRLGIEETTDKAIKAKPPKFAPAGQSTQMIVGADAASDGEILSRSAGLYGAYGMRRVYYSAYSPIPDTTSRLPPVRPPLMREHRLYQADWLMRFYGFEALEIASGDENLDLAIDPKLAWALKNRARFPVDLNKADREPMLRVPGLGVKSVDRMIEIRRYKRLTLEDVKRLTRGLDKVRPFIITDDWRPGSLTDRADLRTHIAPQQLSLF
ncbi:putative DNA modification/repair radical SAM protein [Phenylobacterium sp.]|uniref:putative DNA modification/repair radical SAM protein n=1 Tax=Phenylobacterium sp. TaxID=1871053 RepID=UPI0010D61DF1|nr:putative DNA modification/repair radical SAM protein [Phenylobacterium sp.]MDP3590481.1 putative DNA modification/repair radical SAM protein [Phenylobacterium sp.]RYG04363.1 MAG: putative DNA modification/repair radical SAM protein [Caulobacteraceae bacterium]